MGMHKWAVNRLREWKQTFFGFDIVLKRDVERRVTCNVAHGADHHHHHHHHHHIYCIRKQYAKSNSKYKYKKQIQQEQAKAHYRACRRPISKCNC